jgi:predicted nucleotidyltransferase
MRPNPTVDEIVAGFLQRKLDVIKSEYEPSMLAVFGSRAKGTARADSDIDLIVVSIRFQDTRYVNRMGEFLNRVRPDVPVDAFCYTPEEFDNMVRKGSPFIKSAMRDSIRIV